MRPKRAPGPAARSAYRFGLLAAAVAGLTGLGALYWRGVLDAMTGAYVLLALFPIYLVVVASILSVWLGYDKDASDLRPVHR